MRSFSARLISWQEHAGRRDLPWQNTRDAYRIWVSEIMLQQTQVATVMPYYLRFLGVFPDVQSLAVASIDAVLQSWSGLGYYRRAHLLHRAAPLPMASAARFSTATSSGCWRGTRVSRATPAIPPSCERSGRELRIYCRVRGSNRIRRR
jgi:A/G-specific adenine glycosylase